MTRAVLVVGLWAFALGVTVVNIETSVTDFTDFPQDYAAARAILEGSSPYGHRLVELGRSLPVPGTLENFHPPTLLVLLVPFGLIGYGAAYRTLAAVGVLGILYLARVTAKRGGGGPTTFLFVFPALLLWYPTQSALVYGTLSIVLAVLLVFAELRVREGRPCAAGAAAGLAAALKLYPLAFLVYFLARRDYRAAAAMAACFGGIVLFTAFVLGADDLLRYATVVGPNDARMFVNSTFNVGLAGLIYPLLARNVFVTNVADAPFLATLLMGAVWAGVALEVGRVWTGRATLPRDPFGTALVVMILLGTVVWSHAFVCLAPAVAGYWKRCRETRRRTMLVVCVAAMSLANEFLLNYLVEPGSGLPVAASAWALSKWNTFGLVGLLLLLLTEERGEPARAPETPGGVRPVEGRDTPVADALPAACALER